MAFLELFISVFYSRMARNRTIVSGCFLIGSNLQKRWVLYRVLHGFCSVVESPELPVWIRIPESGPPLEENPEDDFLLPTELDGLGNWFGGSRVHSGEIDVGIGRSEVVKDVNVSADVISNVLKGPFSSPEAVVRALDSCSVKVSEELVDKMLKRLNNDWILAFGFFSWVDAQASYAHSCNSYDAMVDILGKAKQFDLMWNLVNEMVQVGEMVSLRTMSKVMRRLAGAGRWSESIDAFHRIEQFGVKKDTSALNALLDTLCKEYSVKRAWDVYLEVRDKICPDASTFNALIHGWCKARKLEEAQWTMEEMRRFGVNPCVISYTCLIEAYCRDKKFHEVDSLLDEMHANGSPPNVVTYTIIMHSLGKAWETQKALFIYDKMKKEGCIPDTLFYNSLIYILSRAGRLEDAYCVYEEMKKNGISPDVTTYKTMITVACHHSHLCKGLKLLREMEQNCCKPDVMTFAPLLKIGCKPEATAVLHYLLHYMIKKDISIDLGTYSLLVNRLCKNGNLLHACLYFEKMVSKGFLPRHHTYTLLMEALEGKNMEKAKGKIRQLMGRAYGMGRSCQNSWIEGNIKIAKS